MVFRTWQSRQEFRAAGKLTKHIPPSNRGGEKDKEMTQINKVGTIEWFGNVQFSLADYLAELDRREEQLSDDAFSNACHPGKSSRMAGLAHQARQEREKNLLALTVKIALNAPLPLQQIPYFSVEEYNSHTWNDSDGCYVDPERYTHPVFTLLKGLVGYTDHQISVSVPKNNLGVMIVTFYSKEDIQKPTNYLLALANKMAKWATPKKVVLLDEYAREKIERTVADLELTLATAKNFLGMVTYCEEQGIKPSEEARRVIVEMEKLRYPGAPAGPDNDIWKVCGLFQRGQTAVHKAASPQQQSEMIAGCKREWKED